MKVIIAPSALSCDLANFASETADARSWGADWLHLDVMDGHFVPNLTFGAPVVKWVRKADPDAFLDCHLMVANPGQWVADFKLAGANAFTFHIEAVESVEAAVDLAKRIRGEGMFAGISLRPKTPMDDTLKALESGWFDLLLVMSVEPGFGGQKFMSEVMTKVKSARTRFPDLNISVDGGVDPITAEVVGRNGGNVVVAGSSIFGAPDRGTAAAAIRRSVEKGLSSFEA